MHIQCWPFPKTFVLISLSYHALRYVDDYCTWSIAIGDRLNQTNSIRIPPPTYWCISICPLVFTWSQVADDRYVMYVSWFIRPAIIDNPSKTISMKRVALCNCVGFGFSPWPTTVEREIVYSLRCVKPL